MQTQFEMSVTKQIKNQKIKPQNNAGEYAKNYEAIVVCAQADLERALPFDHIIHGLLLLLQLNKIVKKTLFQTPLIKKLQDMPFRGDERNVFSLNTILKVLFVLNKASQSGMGIWSIKLFLRF